MPDARNRINDVTGFTYAFDGGESTISGTPQTGSRGVQSGLYYADVNENDQLDADEDLWSDRPDGAAAYYDAGIDLLIARYSPNHDEKVYDGEIPATLDRHDAWSLTGGELGRQAGLRFHDANSDGVWQLQEDIWRDSNGNNQYDAGETLIDFGDAVDVTAGSPGIAGALYYFDANSSRTK